MQYGNKVYIIRVTEGWADDPNDEYMEREAFLSDVDANIYCEKLANKYTTGWDEDIIFQKVWYGHQLKVYEMDGKRKIEHVTYSIEELNLHK